MNYNLIAPCYFGTESTAAFEVRRLGAEDVQVTDGRIAFAGGAELIAAANLNLRCAERVLVLLKSYAAFTFDELFDGVAAIPWEELLPADAQFPVKGSSLSSVLSSVPACQSIVKKAVVERLKRGHRVLMLPETGALYKIRFSIRKNQVEIMLDTSGDGLHKRGYRRNATGAPIKETLAAAIADLGRVRRDSQVADPFCGSGTLVIEAAQKAMNIAPGLRRRFAAEHYSFCPPAVWAAQREKALAEVKKDAAFEGVGYDIDPQAPVHFLVIPKQHIASAAALTEDDAALLGHIYAVIAQLCKKLGVDESGYRVVTNVGADGGQSVKHLHFHVLAKRSLAWPPG